MRQELFCHKCDDYREINVTEKKEIYPVKGEDTEILALVSSCKACGEELFNEKYDEENLERAYEIYRRKNALLSTSEIKQIRDMHICQEVL